MRLASLLPLTAVAAPLFILVAPLAHAQVVMGGMSGGIPNAPTGAATVTGTVFCADNNRPARFARVSLMPAAIDDDAVQARYDDWQKSMEQSRARSNSLPIPAPTGQELSNVRTGFAQQMSLSAQQSTSVTADFNGHYTITGVAPGIYYVRVKLPGYADALDQFSFDQLTSTDTETIKRLAASAPRITIIGAEEERADVRLERGAILSGRILYDDGAPASGWQVAAEPGANLHRDPENSLPTFNSMSFGPMSPPPITDDLGNFRITGLAPGSYGIRAVLNTPIFFRAPGSQSRIITMTLYSGDTFHMGEAKIYTVTAGATRGDITITIPLNKLHSIRGNVVAESDGHGPNQGNISLFSKDDPAFRPYTNLNPDGSFQLDFVPAGTYTLTVISPSDMQTTTTKTPTGGTRTSTQQVHRYDQASVPVVLEEADLTGVTVTVSDSKVQPKPITPEAVTQ